VSTSYELIKLTPLLQVNDDSFSIIGKGNSTVYINGRNPNMETTALVEMLKALPAEQVKSIEIITTPGSTHAASSSEGIINVVLDNPTQGLIGSATANANYYNERISPSASVWMGYSRRRLNLALSMAYRSNNIHTVNTNTYNYNSLEYVVRNDTRISGWNNVLTGRFNASYNLTAKSSLGMAVNLTDGQSHQTSGINSSSTDASGTSSSNAVIKNSVPWRRPNIGVQTYYTLLTDTKGSNLDVSVDYTTNISNTRTEYLWQSEPETQTTNVSGNAVHIKPQYKFVFNDKHQLDVGCDFFHSRLDNDYSACENSNRFLYKEGINSGFLNYNAGWSEAFNTTVGLRVENTNIDALQHAISGNFSRNYTDFFPSFSCSLDLPWSGNQNVSFSISRFILRPYYSSLNPFVYKTSETTYTKGNTDLRPSYEWEISMYYSFLNDFVFGVSYNIDNNTCLDYTYREGEVTISSVRNFDKSKSFDSFIEFNRVFGGFWRVKTSVSFGYDKYSAWLDDVNLGLHSCSFSYNLQNNIILSKSKKIRLFMYYALYSPVKSITNNGKYKNLLSFSVNKKFANGLTLSLEASNLFGFKNDCHFSSVGYSYKEHTLMYPAQVIAKFNYSFGKRRVSGADDRYHSALDSRFKE
jgi:hypothetical protein